MYFSHGSKLAWTVKFAFLKILQYHAVQYDADDRGVVSNLMFSTGFPKISMGLPSPLGENLNIQSE